MCFLFLNKASSPCYAVSLSGHSYRQDHTISCPPAAKLPPHPDCINEHHPCTRKCPRRCSFFEPSKALMRWEGHNAQAPHFSGQPQASLAAKEGGIPRKAQLVAPCQYQYKPSAARVVFLVGSLRITVNGATLAKDKLFPQELYSYTVQGQQGCILPVAEHGSVYHCLCHG